MATETKKDNDNIFFQSKYVDKLTKVNQSLVHIKHNVTEAQCKYWYFVLSAYLKKFINGGLQDSIDKEGFFIIKKSEMKKAVRHNPKPKDMEDDFEALRKEPIIINLLRKDGRNIINGKKGMGFISEWKIDGECFGFKLPSFIKEALTGDDKAKKMFLLLNWDIFHQISGKYEAIIYKLCKDYEGSQGRRTPFMTIEEYREYIGLADDEYNLTSNLTKRCIKEPVNKLNNDNKCDITIEPVFEKQGRKTVGLHFNIASKNKNNTIQNNLPMSECFKSALVFIEPEKQIEYLSLYNEEQIEGILYKANKYVEKLKSKGKKPAIKAIYDKAFNEAWGLDVEVKQVPDLPTIPERLNIEDNISKSAYEKMYADELNMVENTDNVHLDLLFPLLEGKTPTPTKKVLVGKPLTDAQINKLKIHGKDFFEANRHIFPVSDKELGSKNYAEAIDIFWKDKLKDPQQVYKFIKVKEILSR